MYALLSLVWILYLTSMRLLEKDQDPDNDGFNNDSNNSDLPDSTISPKGITLQNR